MTVEVDNTIEKAEITVPAPGTRIWALKKNPSRGVDMPSAKKRVNADIYTEMYKKHPWLRAAVDKIAKTAAKGDITFAPSDPEVEPIVLHRSDLVKFFRRSHGRKLLRATYRDLLVYGEAFWWIDMTLGGKPQMAMRLHPKHMDAVVQDDDLVEWRYGPVHQDADAIFYRKEVILHFAIEDPDTDLQGLSPLESLMETVAQDLFAMRYNRSFFENAAQTGVIFNMRNATKDEVDRNRTWLEQNYQGASNAHRPIILEGDIEVDKSVSTAQEMEFIELRKLNRAEVFGVLDIAPEKMGINEDSNRSVGKEADNSFREETIGPLQAIVEEEVNDRLILDLFGWEDILFQQEESDARSRLMNMTIYRDAIKEGVMTRNEARTDMGKKKIEGGDVTTVSTSVGVISLEHALANPPIMQQMGGAPQQSGGQPEGREKNAVNSTEPRKR